MGNGDAGVLVRGFLLPIGWGAEAVERGNNRKGVVGVLAQLAEVAEDFFRATDFGFDAETVLEHP